MPTLKPHGTGVRFPPPPPLWWLRAVVLRSCCCLAVRASGSLGEVRGRGGFAEKATAECVWSAVVFGAFVYSGLPPTGRHAANRSTETVQRFANQESFQVAHRCRCGLLRKRVLGGELVDLFEVVDLFVLGDVSCRRSLRFVQRVGVAHAFDVVEQNVRIAVLIRLPLNA